jgi:hypothetical protein
MKQTKISPWALCIFLAIVAGAFLIRNLLTLPMYIAAPIAGAVVSAAVLMIRKPAERVWRRFGEVLIWCSALSLVMWIIGRLCPACR